MIISENRKPPIEAFRSLMRETDILLNNEAKTKESYYSTRNGTQLEQDVFEALCRTSKDTPFENTILYEFYDMVIRLFTDSDSATDRMDAIVTNIRIFLQHPLLGDSISNVLHGTNHNTSSTLLLYAILGVVGGTLNVAAWVALAWKRERSTFGNLVLLLALFMSFNTQNLIANVYFWLFPMMALTERGLPVLNHFTNKE